MKRCAFTGHRRYSEPPDYLLLDRVVNNLMANGVNEFYCGMAAGFDLDAAETVLRYKNDYGAKLIACIPCPEQDKNFSAANRQRYGRILENCDRQIVLEDEYFAGCMQQRDRFLVDNCDVLVCFLRKKSGGTYYTVNYARSKDIKIIEL